MNSEKYLTRIIENKLAIYLKTFGAVCVEGPKWCGKTRTSQQYSVSSIYLGDPAGNFQNRTLALLDPALTLEGEKPRLIDEWQEAPLLWDAVRHYVDINSGKGQFILTGSSTPNHKGVLHSGAGRIAKLRMRPMSLFESNNSEGSISLAELCENKFESKMVKSPSLQDIIDWIIRGGWPASLNLPIEHAMLLPVEYINAVIDDDVFRVDGVHRDKTKMKKLLRSLARNECTLATNKTLNKDIQEIDNEDVSVDTISSYLDIFSRLYLTDNLPPFGLGIRSSSKIRRADKRRFIDPSLACALLNCTPQNLLNDLNTLGFLFESLCIRDLIVYAESFGGTVYYYQEYDGYEIDAIVELANGDWCAFEIKLGANQVDKAAENLLKIQKRFSKMETMKQPKVLCVICGISNAAYQREDGVYVVPISALRD